MVPVSLDGRNPMAVKKRTMTKGKPAGTKEKKRKVIYPEPMAAVFGPKNPLTVEVAKGMLGWEVEPEGEDWGDDYLVRDEIGKKVRCTCNIRNRPFQSRIAKLWESEILQGNWQLNGETLIIGKTGITISAQHRLVGLVLAAQRWARFPDDYPHWKKKPTLQSFVAYGVEEDDRTVNTVDTVISRSLSDVIYRSGYFDGLPKKDALACCRMADHAIRLIWYRTGAGLDAFAPKATHADSLDFLSRHEKILVCVRHVHEKNEARAVGRYISPGYASGLMYLMGCSKTDPEACGYHKASDRHEGMLDWEHWGAASDFWADVGGGGKRTGAFRDAINDLIDVGGGTNAERWALACLAWIAYVEGETLDIGDLTLQYDQNNAGDRVLIECPTVGGIDLGKPKKADAPDFGGVHPDEEELEKRVEKVKEERKVKEEQKAKKKPLVPSKSANGWSKGDVAWVKQEEDEQPYLATLIVDPYEVEGLDVCRVDVQDQRGDAWDVTTKDLRLKHPDENPKKIKSPRRHKSGTAKWEAGMKAWVADKEPYQGRIVEVFGKNVRIKVEQGHQGAGSIRVVSSTSLSSEQPGRSG